jgi:hypothetical protein
VFSMRDLPGGEVLLGADKGLFLARVVNGAVTIAPAGNADTGRVFGMLDFPGRTGGRRCAQFNICFCRSVTVPGRM